MRIKRLITRGRHGSELTLGLSTLDPGEEANRWSSRPENDAGPAERWRAIRITDFERRQMVAVRKELDHESEAHNRLKTKPAAKAPQTKLSSSTQT